MEQYKHLSALDLAALRNRGKSEGDIRILDSAYGSVRCTRVNPSVPGTKHSITTGEARMHLGMWPFLQTLGRAVENENGKASAMAYDGRIIKIEMPD